MPQWDHTKTKDPSDRHGSELGSNYFNSVWRHRAQVPRHGADGARDSAFIGLEATIPPRLQPLLRGGIRAAHHHEQAVERG
jgi:hypothetical protein